MADALGYLKRSAGILPAILKRAGGTPALLFLTVAGFLTGAASSLAQPVAPPVRFSVFSPKPIKDVGFAPRAGSVPQPVAFAPTARSPRYEYRGPMPLRFIDVTSGVVVAEANIPAGIRDALLLFSPIDTPTPTSAGKGAGTLRYQIAVLDDSAARLAPGSLSIVNLSGLALSGTVNKEKLTLQPGLNAPLAVGRAATIALRTTFKGRSYQSYAGTAALGRNDRALLILFPPFYAGSLEVQSRLLIDPPPGAAVVAPAPKGVAPAGPAKR